MIVKTKGREALYFRSSRGLVLSGLLFIAITLIAACLTIWDLREERIADEMRDAQSLGVVLAEQTARTIQAIDLVVQQTQAMVRAKGIRPRDLAPFMTSLITRIRSGCGPLGTGLQTRLA